MGVDKHRPTYDQLDPIHWMAGCLKCAADISESDRPKYLQYLTDLLQDAADFSFENAKARHTMVLTTMEFDRISWSDTLELDRLRRQHAQRHSNPAPTHKSSKSKGAQNSEKNEIPCKFFNDGYCSRSETHFTKGTWYLHICSKCKGDHAASAKKCKPKN